MQVWNKEINIDKAVKIILFILNPIFAVVYSFKTINTKSSYTVFFLFGIIFGLSFSVDNQKSEQNKFDGSAYREKFDRYLTYGEEIYYLRLNEYVNFSEGDKDFYFDTIAYFVSIYTDNYHFLFLIIATIFAFFALKSLRFLTSEPNFETSVSCFILTYIFMINQIFNINGLRFWTAAWIGIYCLFQIYRNNNKKYFWLVLLTPFVHGAYWIFVIFLIISYLFKKINHNFLVFLFLVSFLISNFSLDFIRSIMVYLPSFLTKTVEAYTNESYLSEIENKSSSFFLISKIFSYLVIIYINFLVWLFIKNSNLIINNKKTTRLYSFLLMWMIFVNFTMPVPSLGGRFILLSFPIISYIWLVNFYDIKYKIVLYLMPFIFLFSIYKQLILYTKVLEPVFYVSSPFYLIYKYLLS
ncbi:EpsG family protein [Croceibacter atlanticus]|uniref:EpsG family protein n=1 Tax=Croceibacter atlanticus TaxID=313588 RepID=UPI0030FCE33C